MKKQFYTLLFLLLVTFAALLAQSPLDMLAMRAIMVNQLFSQERVYLHFDNTAYYLGETMWFKAYTTSGIADNERPISKVLYVELCAPEGCVVETKKYKVDENGRCNGEFELKFERPPSLALLPAPRPSFPRGTVFCLENSGIDCVHPLAAASVLARKKQKV